MDDNPEIKAWLESILNIQIPSPLSLSLTDGKLLLLLTYKLQNINTPIDNPRNIFESMEYINKFTLFCRSLEVPEENLIMSNDIKNFKLVQNCIYSFSRYAERKGLCKGIGPKIKFNDKKVVNDTKFYRNSGKREICGVYEPVYVKEYVPKPVILDGFATCQGTMRQIGGEYRKMQDEKIIKNEIETNENRKNVDLQKERDEEYEKSYLNNDRNYMGGNYENDEE